MKLIIGIVNSDDAGAVTRALSRSGFSSTRLRTTGGFLMSGNVTLLVGVEEDKVEAAIDIIRAHSHSRKEMLPGSADLNGSYFPTMPVEVMVGGATIFVVDVERFERA